MEASFCFNAARSNIDDARRYLKIGEGTQWVADNLSTGLLWAMEGWVIARVGQISHGEGWNSTRLVFYKHATTDLCSQVESCYAEAVYLDFEFLGRDDELPPMPMDEWKAKILACLEKTENIVRQLINEAESSGFRSF